MNELPEDAAAPRRPEIDDDPPFDLEQISADLEPAQDEPRREGREAVIKGHVTIAGAAYDLSNWSASGFLVAGYRGELERGDRVAIEFTVLLPGGPLTFSCHAFVVRADRSRQELAAAFVSMDRADRRALTEHFA